jgi:serine/threonine-protein kinase
MAPEQAAGGREVDARADLYSLGIVGYEMLAGAPPFSAATAPALLAAHLMQPAPPVHAARRDTPPHVNAAIARALEKDPALRFASADEFRAALEQSVPAPRATRNLRRPRALIAGTAIVAVPLAALLLTQRDAPVVLSDDLVVVAPFNIPPGDLAFWREGLVDLLARKLDGAGPIRTVPPTLVVRRAGGRSDAASAVSLARATGAQFAVFGELLPSAGDSMRVSVTILDALTGPLGDVEVVDHVSRADRLSDSLAVGVLRTLSNVRSVGVARYNAISARSLPALKALLKGEQHFRHAQWDSAYAAYEETLELDSTSALAMRRLGTVIEWREAIAASRALDVAARATRHTLGLSGHDSLLAVADSFRHAYLTSAVDGRALERLSGLVATMEEATRRYPTSPEAWHELGQANFHFTSKSERSVLAEFDHSIALDSGFAPAYIHPIELALRFGDVTRARSYTRGYLAQHPTDAWAESVRALDDALANASGAPQRIRTLIDTTRSASLLQFLGVLVTRWPDSSELAVRIAARRLTLDSSAAPARHRDLAARRVIAHALAYRGRPRAAFAHSGDALLRPALANAFPQFLELALFGAVPHDSAARTFDRFLRSEGVHRSTTKVLGMPWWAIVGDSMSLRTVQHAADSAAAHDPRPAVREFAAIAAQAARGYLALARRDSSDALRWFTSYPDSAARCWACLTWRLTRVQLLSAAGRDREAAALLDLRFWFFAAGSAVLWEMERARVAERLGDRAAAIDSYAFVAAAWANAEPDLQQITDEARRGLQRLGVDRPPRN